MAIRGGVALGFTIALLGADAAHAQAPQRVKLRYAAPTECPDDLELVQSVEGFLGQSLRDAREQSLTIDARVQGDQQVGYSAKLSFDGSEGSLVRFIDHADCAKLVEAAALMVAIAIDPERVKQRQQADENTIAKTSEPATESAAPPAPPSPPAPIASTERAGERAENAPAARATDSASFRPHVSVLALANGGMLPSVAPGIGVDLSFRYRWLEVGVGGRMWATRNQTVPTAPASSVDITLAAAVLRLCGVPTSGRWSLLLCLGGHLGEMQGVGQHVDHARTGRDGFAAVSGGGALAYSAGRFVPLVGVDMYATLARPRFGVQLNGRETLVFKTPPWGLGGFVGLAYRL